MILLIGSPKTNPKTGVKEIDKEKKMTNTARRKKERDLEGKFFLYVFFFHMWSGLVNLFRDDD